MQTDDVQEGFVRVVVMLGIHMRDRTERVRPEDTEFIKNVVEFAEEGTRRLNRTGEEGQTVGVKPLHTGISGGGQNAVGLTTDADGRNLPAPADKVTEEPAHIIDLLP